MSSKTEYKAKEKIQFRRNQVIGLHSEGKTQAEISKVLQVSIGLVNSDLQVLKRQSKNNIKTYVEQRLPFEYDICHIGVNRILRKAWDLANNPNSSEKAVLQALSLAKECYAMKQGLLADKTVIDRAVEFVLHQKELEVQSEIDNVFTQRALEERNRGNAVF